MRWRQEIDTALLGSLWARTLAHESESRQKVVRALLVGRARFLWTNTTASQRKSYFFAGVSFSTGQYLDTNAEQLTHLLTAADAAFASSDVDGVVTAVTAFAEIIFEIEPFQPDDLLLNWKHILDCWIRGIDLSDLAGGQEEDTAMPRFARPILPSRS